MTHDHKDGCCGSGAGKENKTSCCGSRNWITGIAVVVAVGSLAYAATQGSRSVSMPSKAKIDTSTLIKGEDKVVAKLNGDAIRKSDVALAIKDLGANVPPESVDAILPAFLDQYINLKLINNAAIKDNVDKDSDVQTQMVNAHDQIIRAAYLKKLFDGKITEDALKAAYKAKYEDQPMPEEVHARHILVDSEQKAKELIGQLDRGANFDKLAQENSKDPSAAKGGDLGYFTKGEMVKEFGDTAFAMSPGQTTQTPIKTQFGWHIIKVEDKRQRAKPSFEEAKAGLEQEARQAILDAKLTELRAASKVEIEDAGKPAAPVPPVGTPVPGGAPIQGEPVPAPAPAAPLAPAAAPAPAQ